MASREVYFENGNISVKPQAAFRMAYNKTCGMYNHPGTTLAFLKIGEPIKCTSR